MLLGSLATSLLLLAGLDGMLAVAGLGDLPPGQASRLKYQQVYPPMLEPGLRPDGSEAWITNDARNPWQAIDRPKARGALRVVAVGGSATAGLGFSPNVSFARELERMLTDALPERRVEVLNLGIVALGSSQVRWIVDDVCRHFAPDVVLVYSGNNEFLEIHAQKFESAQEGGRGLAAWLGDTNLARLLGGLDRDAKRGRNVTIFDMSDAQARVSETEMMRMVELTPEEHQRVVATYEANLRAIVDSAKRAGCGVLLMTVASNWEWQGKADLPAGWIDELLAGSPAAAGEAAGGGLHDPPELQAALAAVDSRASAAPVTERHTWLFKRGKLLEQLGRFDEARDALRAAMDCDPRLRRATDELADRVRKVAADTGAPLLDAIARLAAVSPHGLIGDELFYDYVHFTPYGTVHMAANIFDALRREGWVAPAPGFSLADHVDARLDAYDALASDPLPIGDWLGVGDLSLVHDRDLWKHQAHVRALDARLAEHPDDVDALVRRANAAFFDRDGFARAQRLYERALELDPSLAAARDNLATLRGTRHP